MGILLVTGDDLKEAVARVHLPMDSEDILTQAQQSLADQASNADQS